MTDPGFDRLLDINGRHQRDASNSQAWMITFTDLLSLMLAFFVLLFSMKQIELDAWRSVVEGLSKNLNPSSEWTDPGNPAKRTIGRVDIRYASDLGYLHAVFDEKIRGDGVLAQSIVQQLDDRLVISLPGELLFASGSATIKPEAETAVAELASVLALVANQVDIVGYTDPDPITVQRRFKSNWELSLARAGAVATTLADAGYVERVKIIGRADSQYYDLSDKLEYRDRMRLARRVDIIVRETVTEEN